MKHLKLYEEFENDNLDTSDLPKMDTRSLKDKLEDLEKSKDENGHITLKDGKKLRI
jgi:hypothetical protein